MKRNAWWLCLLLLLVSMGCTKEGTQDLESNTLQSSLNFSTEIEVDDLRALNFNLDKYGKTSGVDTNSKFDAYVLFAHAGLSQPISVLCQFEYDAKKQKFVLTKVNDKRYRTVTINNSDINRDWFVAVVKGMDPITGRIDNPNLHKKIERNAQTDMPRDQVIDMDPYSFASTWVAIDKKELAKALTSNNKLPFTAGSHTLKPLGYFLSISFKNDLPNNPSIKLKNVSIKGTGVSKTFSWNLKNVSQGNLPTANVSSQSEVSFDADESINQNEKGSFHFVYFMPTNPAQENNFYVEAVIEGQNTPYRSPDLKMPALTASKGNKGKYFGLNIKPLENPNAFPLVPIHNDIVNPINRFLRNYVISTDPVDGHVVNEAENGNYSSVNGIGPRHLIDSDQSNDFKPNNKHLLTGYWTPKPNATPNGRVYPTLGDFTALFPLYDTDLSNMKLNTDFDKSNLYALHDWFNVRMTGNFSGKRLKKKVIRNKKDLTGVTSLSSTEKMENGKTLAEVTLEQPMELVTMQSTDGSSANVVLGAEYIINADRADKGKYPNNVVYGKRFIGGYDLNGLSANGSFDATDLNDQRNFVNGDMNRVLASKFPKNEQLSAWSYEMRVVKLSGKAETIHVDIRYCYLGPDRANVSIEEIADEDWWANQNNVVMVTYKFPRINSLDYIGHITKSYASDEANGVAFLVDKHRMWKEPITSVRHSTEANNYLRLGVIADPSNLGGAGIGN